MSDSNPRALRSSAERPASTASGYAMLLVILIALVAIGFSVPQVKDALWAQLTLPVGLLILSFVACGFYLLQPNQAAAILLFGEYQGTDRTNGLRWAWPWLIKKKVSVRIHNITSERLKVNDLRGNPIEIASNVVWRVADTAQALFDVDDYREFVHIQIESAVRAIGSRYPYDDFTHEEITLRGNADHVSEELRVELQERVEMALEQLSEKNVVELDDERRAAMVSNLMVVLCSERDTQPVVNAGSLYQ